MAETDDKPKRQYVRKKEYVKEDRHAIKLKRSMARPITSPEELKRRKEERIQINKTNRQRSKDQERSLAKELMGDRTPMSGAGSTKGDVRVQFVNRPGHYMIEAKLSARRLKYNNKEEPAITLQGKWLIKMQEDAKAMRSLFPILAIKFMGFRDSYVMIDILDLAKIYQVNELYPDVDWTMKNTTGVQLFLPQLREYTHNYGICVFRLKHGTYYLMTLAKWKEIIHDV